MKQVVCGLQYYKEKKVVINPLFPHIYTYPQCRELATVDRTIQCNVLKSNLNEKQSLDHRVDLLLIGA